MKNYYDNHEWISASLLKIFEKSPAKAKAAMEAEQTKTEALLLGTAFHQLMETGKCEVNVFDPEERPEPNKDFRSPPNREWKKSFGECINIDQFIDLKKMVAAVKSSSFYKGLTGVKLESIEEGYYIEIAGNKAKCKPDALYKGADGSIICVDWKTTAESLNGSVANAARIVKKHGYDIQAVHYTEILKAYFKKPVNFFFIFVEKVEPFDVLPVWINPQGEFYDLTFARWFDILQRANTCFKTGNWPTLEESLTNKYIQL
jgi:hypothetical protein